MHKRYLVSIVVVLFCVTGCFSQARRSRNELNPQRPTTFYVSEDLARQLISDSNVVRNIYRDIYGENLSTFVKQSLPKGDIIYLTRDGQPAYVVWGPRELAGRNSPAWLYRKTRSGYELILSGSNGFKPLHTWTNGYRDLESSGGIGAYEGFTIIYKYDGRRYQEKSRKILRYNEHRTQQVIQLERS